MRNCIERLRAAVMAALLCVFAGSAAAQDYPGRPVTLVAPFPAGGGNDTIARIVAGSSAPRSASRWWWTIAPAPMG